CTGPPLRDLSIVGPRDGDGPIHDDAGSRLPHVGVRAASGWAPPHRVWKLANSDGCAARVDPSATRSRDAGGPEAVDRSTLVRGGQWPAKVPGCHILEPKSDLEQRCVRIRWANQLASDGKAVGKGSAGHRNGGQLGEAPWKCEAHRATHAGDQARVLKPHWGLQLQRRYQDVAPRKNVALQLLSPAPGVSDSLPNFVASQLARKEEPTK